VIQGVDTRGATSKQVYTLAARDIGNPLNTNEECVAYHYISFRGLELKEDNHISF